VADPVFDSNIVIDWLRRKQEAFDELDRYGKHLISRVTWGEVLAGEPVETRYKVEALIAAFEVVEVDGRIMRAAADIRFRNRIKLLDAIILATAQLNGSILVTRNTKDFPANMPGVRVPYTL